MICNYFFLFWGYRIIDKKSNVKFLAKVKNLWFISIFCELFTGIKKIGYIINDFLFTPWYLYKMVAKNMGLFERKKIEYDDSVDVTKCLQQIEIPDLLDICPWCSELPFNKSTMISF